LLLIRRFRIGHTTFLRYQKWTTKFIRNVLQSSYITEPIVCRWW